jgi:hypothetical protein
VKHDAFHMETSVAAAIYIWPWSIKVSSDWRDTVRTYGISSCLLLLPDCPPNQAAVWVSQILPFLKAAPAVSACWAWAREKRRGVGSVGRLRVEIPVMIGYSAISVVGRSLDFVTGNERDRSLSLFAERAIKNPVAEGDLQRELGRERKP